ncbi:hypothetical protein [Metallosphaera cuprina]|uniref:Uncharacterized protein n=1 Tax=Metallosphaera cuprina (strain Ar-4) TaxID=1006006 RepID=F4G0H8_METCR|nr:hypothetical protein [Metallosphaera cuprina]AEB95865.1 conserved hypothetical protein [Metallosphaera cuprina Ar-4]
MESEFYRKALIRNFLTKFIDQGLSALNEAGESDRSRVCSCSKEEIKSLIESTAEFILGKELRPDDLKKISEEIIEWCKRDGV